MSHNTHTSAGQIAGRVLYALGAGNCQMQIEKCKLQIASPQPLAPSPWRRGISLTEVLIAMGILTVGLLGVASIFPVASAFMQRGDVADRGSAIAQAAFNELLSRGMLNPENWRVIIPRGPATQPNLQFSADRVGNPATLNVGTFTRPFAAAMREAQAQSLTPEALSQNFGGGYVIDPMGVNAFASPNQTTASVAFNLIAMPFPASFYRWFPPGSVPPTPATSYASWAPWSGGSNSPLRRVTFRDPTTVWQLGPQLADRMFRSTDDLALEVPTAADKPSRQRLDLFDLDGDGQVDDPLARQSAGNYSWLATILPSTTEALLGLAYGGAGHVYEVSVAVFYKRVLPSALPTGTDMPIVAGNERMARARVISTGLSGGELRLERHSNDLITDIPESPFQNLKVGNWVIVCGPHPQSSSARPLFVARWYRVLSIEKQGDLLDPGADQRVVSLRGPQWPWQPATTSGALDLTTSSISNGLCVAIIPNVVAVHSKSIMLGDKSAWSIQ